MNKFLFVLGLVDHIKKIICYQKIKSVVKMKETFLFERLVLLKLKKISKLFSLRTASITSWLDDQWILAPFYDECETRRDDQLWNLWMVYHPNRSDLWWQLKTKNHKIKNTTTQRTTEKKRPKKYLRTIFFLVSRCLNPPHQKNHPTCAFSVKHKRMIDF